MKKIALVCETPCYKMNYVPCTFFDENNPPTEEELEEGYDHCFLGYGDGLNVSIVWKEIK